MPQAPCATFGDLRAIYALLEKKYGGKLEALHRYQQADGSDAFFVIRWRGQDGNKVIRPAIKTTNGIELKGPNGQRPLYQLPKLTGAETVIITEGESKSDILSKYGFVSITSSGGSNAAKRSDWGPLAGKDVIIWPDADEPGRRYAADVQTILEPLGCKIKTIDPYRLDLRGGEDVVDYVRQWKNAGATDLEIKAKLSEVFMQAESTGPGQTIKTYIEEIGAGRWEPILTGFSKLDTLVQILPASLNLICGGPGASKSLWMLQIAAEWYRQKYKIAFFELEQDRTHHLRRLLAQESENSLLTNNAWIKENPEIAAQVIREHLDFINDFGRFVWAMPDKMIYQKDIVGWIRERAEAGCKAIAVDPATRAERIGEPWRADTEFINTISRIAVSTRTAVFLILHPSKSINASPDLATVAGSAAYTRFADNVIWLENHDYKQSSIQYSTGTIAAKHNRTVWILKTKDGPGTGARLAYNFDPSNLKLCELGLIVKKKKGDSIDCE